MRCRLSLDVSHIHGNRGGEGPKLDPVYFTVISDDDRNLFDERTVIASIDCVGGKFERGLLIYSL